MSETTYKKLRAIDVSEHIEKKGQLSYLSWAWAVDQMQLVDSHATWEFLPVTEFADGTVMVWVSVTINGKTHKMPLPVMDHRNKAISKPDAFAVNTAYMRCLVKCIAVHGLGLYIYAGEDLPEDVKEERQIKAEQDEQNYLALIRGIESAKTKEELEEWSEGAKSFVDAGASNNHANGLRAAFRHADLKFKEAA